MRDREMVLAVVVIVAAYYWFVVKGKGKGLKGSRQQGSGTTAGGGSKAPTNHHNTNPLTNAQQGRGTGFRPAPIARVGAPGGKPQQSAAGAPQSGPMRRSSTGQGAVTSFISPAWPTQRVTSTGSRRISSGAVQVPGYAAVPLTTQGVGGGGSWLH